jgi:hypothetical protein
MAPLGPDRHMVDQPLDYGTSLLEAMQPQARRIRSDP